MKKVRLGILGFGTVGRGVRDLLKLNSSEIAKTGQVEIEIKKILVKNLEKHKASDIDETLFTDRFEDVLNDGDIDIIVEMTGSDEEALGFIMRAMEMKKSVVSCNKKVIARHARELFLKADKEGVAFRFEGSTMGAVPVIKTISEDLAANRINKLCGIMNGTSNFILSDMESNGNTFEAALREAVDLGYAERNPIDDVSGNDSGSKLVILSTLAFNSFFDIDKLKVEGIDKLTPADFVAAKSVDCTIKLIAVAERTPDGIYMEVKPMFVPKLHKFYSVNGAVNSIIISANCAGNITLTGNGAGKFPTASAVVADIIDIALKRGSGYKLTKRIFSEKVILENPASEPSYYIEKTGESAGISNIPPNGNSVRSFEILK